LLTHPPVEVTATSECEAGAGGNPPTTVPPPWSNAEINVSEALHNPLVDERLPGTGLEGRMARWPISTGHIPVSRL